MVRRWLHSDLTACALSGQGCGFMVLCAGLWEWGFGNCWGGGGDRALQRLPGPEQG